MSKLVITRGLPASGKSTYAHRWVFEDPVNRVRVNRDDLRQMVDNGQFVKGITENRIILARDELIRAYLRRGYDVINDDTNLRQRTVRGLKALANQAGAEFWVADMTDVPPDTCIARDARREKPVGRDVILDQYTRFLKGKEWPLPLPADSPVEPLDEPEPYVLPDGKPPAVLVDIDGTVAQMNGRSPYDMTRVSEDAPKDDVIQVVRTLQTAGYNIVFLSGRTEDARDDTEQWLRKHVLDDFELHMRAAGDGREDSIIKREIFDREIRQAYRVLCVLDDRDRVVQGWRSLGLTCLQVAPGNF